uniref:Lipocalin-2 1 n=1 Tax=Amblyomma americanum TaxID=6943 RepID=A0A0C9S4W3_AMBAM
MNFFTVTLFLALGVMSFGDTNTPPKLEDLRKALNTGEKIWMAYRSYEMQISEEIQRCNNVVKDAETLYTYNFTQTFKYGEQRDKKLLYVDIKERPEFGPELTVKNATGGSVVYTMQFWDPNNYCFVLTFQKNGQQECELHFWDKVIKHGTPTGGSCMQHYGKLCPGRKNELYSPDCQNL